jgi:glycosyltransferase involved in cell wall biosynthesis
MKVLIVLTYFTPHISGLTIYAQRLAKALVRRGHEVTVFTMRYDRELPECEVRDGVTIRRVNVLFRISKGCIAPRFGMTVHKLLKEHDVVNLHLPQFDAAGVGVRARLLKKPCVITYQCDLKLPATFFNRLVKLVVDVMNTIAAVMAQRVVTITHDYAEHSRYLSRYKSKLTAILPPMDLPRSTENDAEKFRKHFSIDAGRPVVGMVARLAAEKGVEVLVDALPRIFEAYPDTVVLFAGQYEGVLGEQMYAEHILPRVEPLVKQGKWRWLGTVPNELMPGLFRSIDLLAVPSLNSTESFGLVQVEAMMNGVPVVASNIPGVRQPVLSSGMGLLAEPGDSRGLAECIVRVLDNSGAFAGDPEQVRQIHTAERCAASYEALFEELLAENSDGAGGAGSQSRKGV